MSNITNINSSWLKYTGYSFIPTHKKHFIPINAGHIIVSIWIFSLYCQCVLSGAYKHKNVQYHGLSFQTGWKVWYIWTFFHIHRNDWMSWELLFSLPLHMVASKVLSLYMNKLKIPRSCTIISKVKKSMVCLNVLPYLYKTLYIMGIIIFTPITYGRIRDALSVYEKIKNTYAMKTL